ncbi:MAG: hypothetical protein WCN92_07865 [Eubacteriales bacterium]
MKKTKKMLKNNMMMWLYIYLPAAIVLISHNANRWTGKDFYLTIGAAVMIPVVLSLAYLSIIGDFKNKKIIIGYNILACIYLPIVIYSSSIRGLWIVSLVIRIIITLAVIYFLFPRNTDKEAKKNNKTEDENPEEDTDEKN